MALNYSRILHPCLALITLMIATLNGEVQVMSSQPLAAENTDCTRINPQKRRHRHENT